MKQVTNYFGLEVSHRSDYATFFAKKIFQAKLCLLLAQCYAHSLTLNLGFYKLRTLSLMSSFFIALLNLIRYISAHYNVRNFCLL
jgi:hypothetical protein